jgi:hypothetical protein
MAQAKTADDQQTGENVILGGLGIQILFFGFFIATAIVFHARIAKRPTAQSYSVPGPWKTHILALYAGSVLILVRSVFRMAEFALGNDGVLMRSEAYLLALDSALMWLVTAVFLWSHPSRVLVGGKDEVVGVGLESGLGRRGERRRGTAESSYQMLAVPLQDVGAVKAAPSSPYDSDLTAGRVKGPREYSGRYDAPPARGLEYSNSYGR